MSIYFVPALVAALFKLFVLGYAVRSARVSIVFLSLIVVFFAHNAIEILAYFYVENVNALSTLFRLYYVATAFVVLYILLHGLSVSKLENKITTGILIGLATGLSALMLFTDIVIGGQYSIGYSMTAVKGSYYWLFVVYLVSTLLGSCAVISYGYRAAKSQIDSVRCLHSLYALAPVMLAFIIGVAFKVADVGINATGLVPISTALFLWIVLKTESKHKLSDLRRVMPLSPERKVTNNLMDLLDSYIQNSGKENVYKELQEGIEKEIIKYSVQRCEGNISNTTKMMGLKNRSTLYSMMNRLEMDLNELKHQKAN
jgi:DNA-binding protein Fis